MMYHKRFSIAVYLGVLINMLDQMSKWWVLNEIKPPPGGVTINPLLNIVLVQNRGVTFGLLNDFDPEITKYFLLAVAGLILILLGRWLWRTSSSLVAAALGMIIGGAIGNIIDRVRFGVVIDFIDFHIGDYHWYSFNVADSAIVTGVGILLLDAVMRER